VKRFFISFGCVFSVVVISLLTPLYAMAAETDYNSVYDWNAILSQNNISIPDVSGSKNYVILRGTDSHYYIIFQNSTALGGGQYKFYSNANSIADTSSINISQFDTAVNVFTIYKSNASGNPYGPYSMTTAQGYDPVSVNVGIIYANSNPIYDSTKTNVVFQQTPSDPAGTTPNLKPIITVNLLSGILTEVTGILPILLPVLITFIAIRKGLKFTLATLRSA